MKKIIWPLIGIVFLAGVAWLIITPGKVKVSVNDGFATCLKDSGAIFYGAFWCPHCAAQKKLFGSASQYLPYVECSTPDGKSQNEVCTAAKIEGYPTWVFPNGTRLGGEQSFETLAKETQCVPPGGQASTSTPPINISSSSPAL